jgi:hypothetical protein
MGASASQLHTNRMANDFADSSESFDRVSGKRRSLPAILNAEKSVPVEDLRNTLFDSESVSNYDSNEISVESATYSDHIIKSQEFARPNSPLVQNTLNALKANMSNPNLNVIKNVSISKKLPNPALEALKGKKRDLKDGSPYRFDKRDLPLQISFSQVNLASEVFFIHLDV